MCKDSLCFDFLVNSNYANNQTSVSFFFISDKTYARACARFFEKRGFVMQCNIQGAVIINNVYSNYSQPTVSTYTYSSNPDRQVGIGYYGAMEFIFGKTVQRIIMLTSERTNSSYNYYSFRNSGQGYHKVMYDWYEYTSKYIVNKRVNTVGLCGGIEFPITKKLHLSPLFSLDYQYRVVSHTTGYNVVYHSPPYSGPVSYDTTYYANSKSINNGEGSGLVASIKLRLSYEIGRYFSVYALGSMGIKYVAPWYMLGVRYYPFRKLK
jgi:hypothetical protein